MVRPDWRQTSARPPKSVRAELVEALPEPVEGLALQTLRHGAFDKLSPLLRANGAEVRRQSGGPFTGKRIAGSSAVRSWPLAEARRPPAGPPPSRRHRHQKIPADAHTQVADAVEELRQIRMQPGGEDLVDAAVLQIALQPARAAQRLGTLRVGHELHAWRRPPKSTLDFDCTLGCAIHGIIFNRSAKP
jgi:hypothetical protein